MTRTSDPLAIGAGSSQTTQARPPDTGPVSDPHQRSHRYDRYRRLTKSSKFLTLARSKPWYRISFLPGGLGLSVSVLLGRVDGMPESLNVEAGGDSIPFLAIDETLYEPIQPLNAETSLPRASLRRPKETPRTVGSGLHATCMHFRNEQALRDSSAFPGF